MISRRFALANDRIELAGGYGYHIILPNDSIGDNPRESARSTVRLFEQGRELGPAHALHEEIKAEGKGRFSHWENRLYFSTGDNSSPLTNGRRYEVLVPSLLSLRLQRWRDRLRDGLGSLWGGVRALLWSYRLALPEGEMAAREGGAYAIVLPQLTYLADDEARVAHSPLRLFEDGHELGPGHTPVAAIQSEGGGRFSHWRESLTFSASDNSSPLTNGRRYEVLVPSLLSLWFGRKADAGWRLARKVGTTATNLLSSFMLPSGVPRHTLFFFYDLRESPVSYDIATQLVVAELQRRQLGLAHIHLVVVPGEWRHREEDGYASAVPPEAVNLRIHQLLLPVAALLPTCRGATVCASRAEAEWMRFAVARSVYPTDYEPARSSEHLPEFSRARDPKLPAEEVFPLFTANQEAKRAAAAFLETRIGGRHAIIITLRQYDFAPSRNSRVAEWVAFADWLDASKYAAVFVPETSVSLGRLEPGLRRHVVCETASWNVSIRMALYEAAYLNMAHMGGPLELALYNEACRYAVFIPVGTSPQTGAEFLQERGFSIGANLPFARPWQRLIWEPDSYWAIRKAFEELVPFLDARPAEGLKPVPAIPNISSIEAAT